MRRRAGTISLMAFALIALQPAGAADWNGFYLGGNLGLGLQTGATKFNFLPDQTSFGTQNRALNSNAYGCLAGLQAGYNWQKGRLVFGIEGDVSAADWSGEKRFSPVPLTIPLTLPGSYLATDQQIRYFGTLRGRIGFLASDNCLLYVTGGAAGADSKYSANTDFRPYGNAQYPTSFFMTKGGWTAGLGAECTLSGQWTGKFEYLYYDLGKVSKTAQCQPMNIPYAVNYTWQPKGHIFRLGVNYRFGGTKAAPIAPREEPKAVTPPPVEEPKAAPVPPPPPPPVEEAKPAPVPPPPPPPAKIVLDQAVLHFANGKNVLSDEGTQAVQKVAAELKKYKGEYTLVVSGHTSSIGSKAFNKALSKRRAEAVAKVLSDSGIPAASIQAEGVGPDQPIADNKTAEGQAKNRRVEIEVKVKGAEVEKRQIQTQVVDTTPAAPAKKAKGKTKTKR